MKTGHDHYTYRVTWSPEDGEYVGLCTEFPSLSWLAKSPQTALQGIRHVVTETIQDMQKNRESIPEPLSTKPFSGRFIIRIPPEIHRRLAMEASEAGVSLNRLVSARLSVAA